MKVIILAAGLGTRLWPLSTPEKPKQFQPLISNQSLLSYTYRILSKIVPTEDLYVQVLAGTEKHVTGQLPVMAQENIITVPEHRDTLAETLWAVYAINPAADEPILFKSVDQYIENSEDFLAKVELSLKNYTEHTPAITLLGAKYQTYSSNSGYVTATGSSVTSFIEKPAESYVLELLKDHTLYRSLFMFIVSHNLLIKALDNTHDKWAEDASLLLKATEPAEAKARFSSMPIIDISSTLFQSVQGLKIESVGDSDNFLDVGRYSALYELNNKDDSGNVIIGEAHIGEGCTNNLIINTSDLPLKVAGTNNMVIAKSPGGSFIANMESVDQVKNI